MLVFFYEVILQINSLFPHPNNTESDENILIGLIHLMVMP